jgi:hypothetical protein
MNPPAESKGFGSNAGGTLQKTACFAPQKSRRKTKSGAIRYLLATRFRVI